jgi:hypothetical protein
MKKLKFSSLGSSLKAVIMTMVVFFAMNTANAWVDQGAALSIAVSQAQTLKNTIDPLNPDALSLVKIEVLNNMINSLTQGTGVADAFYSSVVFKTTGTGITTATAVDSRGVDTKSLTGELYNLFQ